MSWYIDVKVNQGYPYNEGFPLKYNIGWYASGDIQLPKNIWRIIPNINNNYPCTGEIPPPVMQTHFKSEFGGIQLPKDIWRITPGINEDYPYVWYFFHEDTESDDGTIETEHSPMEIGGYRSNYPAFSNNNKGGIRDQFGNHNFVDDFNPDTIGARMSALGITYRSWIINGAGWAEITNGMTSTEFIDAVSRKFDKFITGVDPTNAIAKITAFPFSISDLASDTYRDKVTAYGIIDQPLTTLDYGHPIRTVARLDFGEVTLDVRQAWELENIQYSIYLPYCGIFQLDIKNAAKIRLVALVDILQCLIQYTVIIDGEPVFITKGSIGVDITPSNFNQVGMQNFIANLPTMVAAGATFAGGIMGSLANSLGGIAFGLNSEFFLDEAIGAETMQKDFGDLSKMASSLRTTNTISYNCPSVGGCIDTTMPPYPRIIAKIQKMHKDAIGYGEILGYSDQVARKISECSGFVKCVNYKCPVIQCTKEEKEMINSLMNSGVFV